MPRQRHEIGTKRKAAWDRVVHEAILLYWCHVVGPLLAKCLVECVNEILFGHWLAVVVFAVWEERLVVLLPPELVSLLH